MGTKWTPEITEAVVELKTQPVLENYPQVGTAGIARLGRTVLHGTFEHRHRPSAEWVTFRIDGTISNDILWFDDGWTFEVVEEAL